jgi:hypothetical protein
MPTACVQRGQLALGHRAGIVLGCHQHLVIDVRFTRRDLLREALLSFQTHPLGPPLRLDVDLSFRIRCPNSVRSRRSAKGFAVRLMEKTVTKRRMEVLIVSR